MLKNLRKSKNPFIQGVSSKDYKKKVFRIWILVFIFFTFSNPTLSPIPISSALDTRVSLSNESNALTLSGVEANSTDFIVWEGEEIMIRDRVFKPPGDIIVERDGRLILRDAEVLFNHTGFYEHGILLGEDTTLEVYNSTIKGLDNLFFLRAWNTTLIIEDSTFRRTHVICGNSSRVSIHHSYLWALHCLNETTADVVDAHLCYLFLMGRSSAKVENSEMIEILLYDGSEASVLDTTLRFIFYFDEGSATISNCSYEDEIRFKPRLCDLTIEVLGEDTLDPLPKASVCLNRPEGNEVASSLTDSDGTASFTDLEEGDYFVEVERKGHTPASARIPLLNETQRETLVMRRIDEESPFSNPYYSMSIWIILTAAVIAFLYKCSRGKDATRDSSLTPDNI